MTEEFYYRITDRLVSAGVDQFDNPLPGAGVSVTLQPCRVLKRTAKGVWVDNYGMKRFVLASARKQFACPTIAEAKTSFIHRKKRYIKILSRRIAYAERAMEAATEMSDKGENKLIWMA